MFTIEQCLILELPEFPPYNILETLMPRESIILECTEARKEGKPPSRYMSSRNKKLQTEAVEKKKYNPFLRRHTIHREIKKS
jgi:large subunit ribosomal protein L33